MRIVDLKEMREIEKITFNTLGMKESLIIETVGIHSSAFIKRVLIQKQNRKVVLICGRGNNGADVLSLARHLHNSNISVKVLLLFSLKSCSPELKLQLKLASSFGIDVVKINESIDSFKEHFEDEVLVNPIIVDGIVGTGFKPPLSSFLNEVIKIINNFSDLTTVSMDIPSGINGDADVSEPNSIMANYTLAVGLPKIGYYGLTSVKNIGQVVLVDAGFPKKLLYGGNKTLLTLENVACNLLKRDKFSYKNMFGHSLIIGGSKGLTGALILAATSCRKVGTGLVTAMTWENNYSELTSRITPEIMTKSIPYSEKEIIRITKDLGEYDSIVIGPGLSASKFTRIFVTNILKHYNGPVVLDADALNVLKMKKDAEILAKSKSTVILTPHMWELARFMEMDVSALIGNVLAHLNEVQEKIGQSILAKSYCSYLNLTNKQIYVNNMPNDAMAKAGNGDLFAGIIGGLLGQNAKLNDGKNFEKMLTLGTVLHSLAARHAKQKLGGSRAVTLKNIMDYIPHAYKTLESIKK